MKKTKGKKQNTSIGLLTFVSRKKSESLLQSNSLTRVLVVWRESGRVCGFGDFALGVGLIKSVDALAVVVQVVHKMHCCVYGLA